MRGDLEQFEVDAELEQQPRLRPAPAPFSRPTSAGLSAPTLPRDWTSTWLVLLTAVVMSFLAGLALAVAAGAGAVTESWTSELAHKATVSLSLEGVDPSRDAARTAQAMSLIRDTEGVLAADPVSEADAARMLAPLLGLDPDVDKAAMADLPLPLLIDIDIVQGASAADVAERLTERFAALHLPAEVDDHEQWANRLEPAAAGVRGLARAGLALIAIAAALMVALACATALAAQGRMVEVLRLVGASDAFVAAIFVRRFQILSFLGSAVGAAGAALALLAASSGSGPTDGAAAEIAPLLPDMTPDPWIWAQLATLPLVFALIATGAAWAACMIVLRRSEG